MTVMHKYDGLTANELRAIGFVAQPDGRMRLRTSWKSQCKACGKWFSRVKGDARWLCYDRLRNEHVWERIREDKKRAEDKRKLRRMKGKPRRVTTE
jgi:hypothetical protein